VAQPFYENELAKVVTERSQLITAVLQAGSLAARATFASVPAPAVPAGWRLCAPPAATWRGAIL